MDGSPASGPATGDIIPGGRSDLWEPVATVTVTVANAGEVDGAEVAQLYVGFPESAATPPRQLRGFEKLLLAAGESAETTFELRRRDLSVWDVERQNWVVPGATREGRYRIWLGQSSDDLAVVCYSDTLECETDVESPV